MNDMRNLKMRTNALVLLAPLVVVFAAACNELAGIHEGKPPGSDVACQTVDDCPPPDHPDCATLTACEADVCQYKNELDGKPLPVASQVIGDCSQIVCDGDGATRLQAFDADAEEDGNPCTQDSCVGGNSVHTPQQMVDCYASADGTPGPAGTKGIGNCKVGIQQCDANFQPIGGCDGAILPAAETCDLPGDEDCDAMINEEGPGCACTPSTTDSCYVGDPAKAGVGICELGQCLCNSAGTACETACMGYVMPQAVEDCSTPTDDDCDGEDVDLEDGCLCVANSNENCYVCDATGKAYAQVPSAIDDCQIPGDDDCDGTAIDSCTGAFKWVKASVHTGANPSITTPTGLAVDAAGNVTMVGYIYSTASIDLGGGVLTNPASAPTNYNVFVASYTPSGVHRWSKVLSCATPQVSSYEYDRPRVTIAGANVVVALRNGGYSCDFGSGTADSTPGTVVVRLNGTTGAFVAKAVVNNMPSNLAPMSLAGAADGSVAIGGWASNNSPAVLKLDSAGTVKWAKTFSTPQPQYGYEANAPTSVAILDDGGVAFAGIANQTTIDFGGLVFGVSYSGTLRYAGVLNAADGTRRWAVGSKLPTSQLALAPVGDDLRVVGGGSETYCDATCKAKIQAETLVESEPNNNPMQADAFAAGNYVAMGVIEDTSGTSNDYFAITVPANANLSLETTDSGSTTTCAGYMALALFDPTGMTQLATDTTGSGIGNCARIANVAAVTNLAAGTYIVRVSLLGSPYQFPYQLNVKINNVGATGGMPTTVTTGHALMLDQATGAATGLAQMPINVISGAKRTSTTIDALGHTTIGGTADVRKFNATGGLLWTQPLALQGEPPIITSAPDGSIYFAGKIYNTVMIGGAPYGTVNNYEIVWGKLAQ